MDKKIIFSITLFILPLFLSAQNYHTMRGIVMDVNRHSIPDVNIILMQDSTFISGTTTNKKGQYSFGKLSSSHYQLHLSHINYKPQMNAPADTIILYARIRTLQEVKVRGSNIKYKANHYQAYLKNDPRTQGKDVDNFLRLLPGIHNHNGWAVHNTPAKIYIDGREIHDVRELEYIPANQLEKAEVTYRSGAGHSAAERHSIIRLTLLPPPQGGLLGSLNTTLGLRPEYGICSDYQSASLNYRYKKWTLYNYLSYSDYKNITHYETINHYPLSKQNITINDKEKWWDHSFSDNQGIILKISPKHTLGTNIRIATSRGHPFHSYLYEQQTRQQLSEQQSKKRQLKYQQTLNYSWKFNDKNDMLQFSADYLTSDQHTNTLHSNWTDFTSDQNYSSFHNKRKGKSHLFKTKASVELNTGKVSSLTFGGEYNFKKTHHSSLYFYERNTNKVDAENLNDNLKINSEGQAVFCSFSSSFSDFYYELGLRFQSDQIRYHSLKTGLQTKKHYTDFFPSLALTYTFNRQQGTILNLNYDRSLCQMPYYELSPNKIYSSQYTYTQGNPSLQPSIEHFIMLAFTLRNNWNFFCNYGQINKYIQYITLLDQNNPLTKYSIPQNIGKQSGIGLGINGTIKLTSWWKLNIDVMLKHGKERNPEIYNRSKVTSPTPFGYFTNFFHFNNNWGGSVNFNFEGRDKFDDKIFHSVWNVSLKVHKYLLNQKIKLQFTSQPLISKRRHVTTSTPELISYRNFKTSQTNFSFRISYNFNWGKKIRKETINPMNHIYRIQEKQ